MREGQRTSAHNADCHLDSKIRKNPSNITSQLDCTCTASPIGNSFLCLHLPVLNHCGVANILCILHAPEHPENCARCHDDIHPALLESGSSLPDELTNVVVPSLILLVLVVPSDRLRHILPLRNILGVVFPEIIPVCEQIVVDVASDGVGKLGPRFFGEVLRFLWRIRLIDGSIVSLYVKEQIRILHADFRRDIFVLHADG